ncbi:MAG: transcriptional regulator [Luteitalea sp.]|nr:transcriptional regulator [Luteitalea sp.]
MPLTRAFKDTVQARMQRDPAYRRELLREGIECLVTGDLETGKTILRDYINATVGFEDLSATLHKSPKSLMRMLGPQGNPRARNLFDVIVCLQRVERVHLGITTRPRSAA